MAGRIPQSFIDELLARVDIVGVVESRVSLKKAGRVVMAVPYQLQMDAGKQDALQLSDDVTLRYTKNKR